MDNGSSVKRAGKRGRASTQDWERRYLQYSRVLTSMGQGTHRLKHQSFNEEADGLPTLSQGVSRLGGVTAATALYISTYMYVCMHAANARIVALFACGQGALGAGATHACLPELLEYIYT